MRLTEQYLKDNGWWTLGECVWTSSRISPHLEETEDGQFFIEYSSPRCYIKTVEDLETYISWCRIF